MEVYVVLLYYIEKCAIKQGNAGDVDIYVCTVEVL